MCYSNRSYYIHRHYQNLWTMWSRAVHHFRLSYSIHGACHCCCSYLCVYTNVMLEICNWHRFLILITYRSMRFTLTQYWAPIHTNIPHTHKNLSLFTMKNCLKAKVNKCDKYDREREGNRYNSIVIFDKFGINSVRYHHCCCRWPVRMKIEFLHVGNFFSFPILKHCTD